jgi:AcrR family transcriptional regulator
MAETSTPRERYRTQVRAEIKERAWVQIATAGASELSLNAIARQMGMTGPALYRYFANRDELITALITDAYRSLADTVRAAAAATATAAAESGDVAGRGISESAADLIALAHVLRGWALEDPQRYFLIYGTPVPGYHAPDNVTTIAAEIMVTVLDACAAVPPRASATLFEAYLKDHRDWAAGHPAPPAALHRALTFWTRLHGILSLELAGHFTGMDFDPAQLFAAELDSLSG